MRAAGEGLSHVVTPLPGAGDKDGTLSSKLLLFVKRGVCQIHFPAVALLHMGFVGCMLALPPLGALDRSKRVSHA